MEVNKQSLCFYLGGKRNEEKYGSATKKQRLANNRGTREG